MRYWLLLACGAGLGLAVVGCSSDKRTLEATGKVTYNGKDMPDGDILFVPDDKSLGAEAGKIKDGRYSVKVRPGKYRVEIRAVRTGTKSVPSAAGPGATELEMVDYVPEENNTKSNLTAEVSSGKTTFDFDIKGPQ